MPHYSTPTIITSNIGNNAFSYSQRKELLGKAQITIPSLIETTLEDVRIGTEIVFEEIDHKGKLHQCYGLQHLVKLETSSMKLAAPTYIMDNHNHALYFRRKHIQNMQLATTSLQILHIDQHSDLGTPPQTIDKEQMHDSEYIRAYTNHACNVGSFIKPFLNLYPKTQFTRIKSESQLLEHKTSKLGSPNAQLIVDIDLDFRAPEMNITNQAQTIKTTQQLIQQASLITIATSPYFLEQKTAIQILKYLFQ